MFKNVSIMKDEEKNFQNILNWIMMKTKIKICGKQKQCLDGMWILNAYIRKKEKSKNNKIENSLGIQVGLTFEIQCNPH